jgi:SSS family solute:Na+ symporter/sodium/pantothenate symporter
VNDLPEAGWGVLAALALVIGISGWLGAMAQRVVERGSFVRGFFLGNRGLGTWAMALTATVQSGGTFMGVPSLIYTRGWIVALWIGAYMLVPLTTFSVLGTRLGQLSRLTGAVTVPDMFRGRFDRPVVGLIASLMILFYMSFMMLAQFKAGAILMQMSLPSIPGIYEPHVMTLAEDVTAQLDWGYYVGLTVFAVTVVGYTMAGGFLASVWTDLFQSVLMLVGVVTLLILAIPAAGGLERATLAAVEQTSPAFASGPGYDPGDVAWLSPSLAMSMFFVWIFGGMASPATMVRVMASRNTAVLRRSIFCLGTYNLFIYIPLICICISARAIIPNLHQPDEVIPRMALRMTSELPAGSLLAGLILSAPFGAVMATVSTFLVLMASGLVRDLYQRFINPAASDAQIKRITHLAMAGIGVAAVIAVLNPPKHLQDLIVFGTTCAASSLLIPALMACYWRRATAAGTIAAMLGGSVTIWALYLIGRIEHGRFSKHDPWGFDPIIFGLAVSALSGIIVSLLTRPPRAELIRQLFDE